MKIRLDKFLSKCGLGSRKEVLKLIKEGKIKVNNNIAKNPALKVDPQKDLIHFKNLPIYYQPFYYYKFYKPKGIITSTKDKEKTIFDLLPQNLPGYKELFPAGRLDKDAEGLIILTNDGELAHKITHPRWKLEKIYEVLIDKPLNSEDEKIIETGIELKDGKTQPCEVYPLNLERTYLKVVVREGRYHLLKRIFGKMGYKVLSIKRIAIGPVLLGDLKPGEVKKLTKDELLALKSYFSKLSSKY